MAEPRAVETMKQLRELLQDEDLRHRILVASDEQEVGQLLNDAGGSRGWSFDPDWLGELFVDVKITRWPPTFTEQELLLLSSQGVRADTAPKLCHSDSCGGGHSGCC
jgi:hypothetical protein